MLFRSVMSGGGVTFSGGEPLLQWDFVEEVMGMLPGIGSKLKNLEVDENAMKKPEAIIRSMTMKERKNPSILNASRRKRIAAGAGVTVQDVNALMRQFEQMQKMLKQFMGNKRGALRAMRNLNIR